MGKRVCRVRRRGFRVGEVGVWRGFAGGGDGDEGGWGGKEAKREVRWGRGLGRGEGGGSGILRVFGSWWWNML